MGTINVAAYWMTANLCRRYGVMRALNLMLPALKFMAYISLLWTIYIGLNSENATAMTVRHKIISEIIPFAFAYLSTAFIFKFLSRSDKIFGGLVLIVLLIGQTRSYLIVLGMAIIFSTLGYSINPKRWIYSMGKVFIIISLFLLCVIFLDSIFRFTRGDSLVELWSHRIFASQQEFGFDQTTASRLAEYHDQMQKLFSSFESAIFGRGLGASYTYSGFNADLFASVLGGDAIPKDYWNGRHSLWVYTLYTSGLIFGVALICFYIYSAWISVKLLRLTGRLNDKFEGFIISVVAVAYLCFIGISFTAFPLGSRSMAFVLGILIALQISLWDLLGHKKYELA